MNRKVAFNNHIVIVGFGAMGQALLPLLFKHIETKSSQITIVTDTEQGRDIAIKYSIDFQVNGLMPTNYKNILTPLLNSGDMLLNMSVDVACIDLMALCSVQGALYVDLSTEPWLGGYTDVNTTPSERTNYALREQCLKLKKILKTPRSSLMVQIPA